MSDLFTVESLFSLLTLSAMEIILGIDNVVFISILTGKLPVEFQAQARKIGISMAFVARILLLLSLSWLTHLTSSLFTIYDIDFSGRDLILIAGGIFLMAKSTTEIHDKVESDGDEDLNKIFDLKTAIVQIVLLDIVFSFDSVLTAVGLVNQIPIMIAAVMISMIIMFVYSKIISDFIEKHPSIKMLALSFLLLIGLMLVLEGFDFEIPKGYVYFAMAFSLLVQFLNIRADEVKKRRKLEKTKN